MDIDGQARVIDGRVDIGADEFLYKEPPVLVGLEITGPVEVVENFSAQYAAIASYDNGYSTNVNTLAIWSVEPEVYATIDENGLLHTRDIDTPKSITIYAQYTDGEVTLEAERTVQIYLSTTWRIPVDYQTIQEAIDGAEDGDTVIVGDGIYKGDGNRDIDFHGKAITLRSENGPQNCIIDCNASRYDEHRGFYFHNGENENSVLDGFSIINGYGFPGGGICLENSSPNINNCVISSNKGGSGAGIGCYSWSGATIRNCTISDNSCSSAGGGFYGGSNLVVTNCIIKRNAAQAGGAVYDCGSAKFVNCIITDNTASHNGGGIECWGADNPTIINCTISGNSSSYEGGGVYCGYKSKATIINCIIWGNDASSGPQIGVHNSSCVVSYSDVQGGWPGTGNIDADPMLALHRYCILSGSPCINAGDPMGDYSGQTDINGDPRVLGGRVDMGADEFTGGFPELVELDIMGPDEVAEDSSTQYTAVAYYNDDFTDNVSIWADWLLEPVTYGSIDESGVLTTGRIQTPGDITISAQYTFLGVTGEAEMTVRVSLPIDLEIIGPEHVRENYQTQYKAVVYYANGQTSDVTDLALWQAGPQTIATIDQNGLLQTEPLDEEKSITISAEYTCSGITVEADMAVEVLLPPCTWIVPTDHRTIQGAIDYCIDGDIVVVADGTYMGEGNTDIRLRGKAITVRSKNGPENCIIDGNNKYDWGRGFWFRDGEDANSILDGFTITNCVRSGIVCGSSPTIRNCIITGNSGYDGGGIDCYSLGRGPTIINCIISGNTTGHVGNGGGIYCYWASPIIIDCTISGNEAERSGGGIYCEEGSSPTLINCTISGNTTDWGSGGGGIYCSRSSPTLINCTIVSNTATRTGGGLRRYDGTIRSCIIWNNVAINFSQLEGSTSPTHSCIQDWTGGGTGNIDGDPCFAEDSCALLEGMVSYWRFDEGNGTIACDSAGENDGTLVNGPAWTSEEIGGALGFDGLNDYVDVVHSADFDIETSFTVELWFKAKPTQLSPDGLFAVIDKSHRSTESPPYWSGWVMQGDPLPSGRLWFGIGNGADFPGVATNTSVLDDAWHHIAGVFDGTKVKLYLDGDLQGSTVFNGTPVNNTDPLSIGRWGTGATRHFNGLIDEVGIYNRALSASEIGRLYLWEFMGREWGWIGKPDPHLLLDPGHYHLLPTSPCIDAGDPNYVGGPNETDLDGNPRVVDGDSDGNSVVDMGAYEWMPPTPAELIAGLLEEVAGLGLPGGIENSLMAKLNAALGALEDENENNDIAGINTLGAFINAVEAQRGKKIPEAEADDLIAAAQQIINLLSIE